MKILKTQRRAYAAKASALKRLLGSGMLLEGSLNKSMRGGSEHWQLTDKADGFPPSITGIIFKSNFLANS